MAELVSLDLSLRKQCVRLVSLLSATRLALRARRLGSRGTISSAVSALRAPPTDEPMQNEDFTAGLSRPPEPSAKSSVVTVTPYQDGPYLLRGPFSLRDQDGAEIPNAQRVVALCRCGKSRTRPFCDGTHRLVDFRAPSGPERPLDIATPGDPA